MNDLYYEPAIATFELPLPTTVNTSYGIGTSQRTGNPRIVSKDAHKQFKKDAKLLLANQTQLFDMHTRKAYDRAIGQVRKQGLFIFIETIFFLENIYERDEDGGLKVVQDVICKHIGINDKYVLDAHPAKRQAHGNSRCDARVYIANQENAL